MKDLKIGDVVITKATLTGDKEYDEALAKKNGLGKIENIVTSGNSKTYLVRVGENNTDLRYYQESELEIALEDLTAADKEEVKKALYKIEEKVKETEKSERTQKFLGTGIELEESEMEKEAALAEATGEVVEKAECVEIKEDKEKEDKKIFVKKIYEIDEELVKSQKYVLLRDSENENRVLIALVKDVSKSNIKLAYVREKELEEVELTAEQFAAVVA